MQSTLYDFSPVLRLLLVGAALASLPVMWVGIRNRSASMPQRMRVLAWVTLFLTFDLVLFGAFTRLTDSGLGCPDWPGCYGHASPLGAQTHIDAAQAALPTGPVTQGKAWVEMLHRYWASAVGGLCLLMTAWSWWFHFTTRKQPLYAQQAIPTPTPTPWWATATLIWVCIQGAFGALTVTMKLFPAIVSLHLLGGYVLLAMLTVQSLQWKHYTANVSANVSANPQVNAKPPVVIRTRLRWFLMLGLGLVVLQAASGAWVSSNYAVLACTEFPQCQGQWWPDADFVQGFTLWRPLGEAQGGVENGTYLPFAALTAIHLLHRLLALLTVGTLGAVAWVWWRVPGFKALTRALLGVLLLQAATGVSNVVLGWPLLAAILHTGGAGALVVILVAMLFTCSIPDNQHSNPP
jgi:heme a synthase